MASKSHGVLLGCGLVALTAIAALCVTGLFLGVMSAPFSERSVCLRGPRTAPEMPLEIVSKDKHRGAKNPRG